MNVKVIDMLNAIESLNVLMGQGLPARIAYKIARLARLINAEIDIFTETKNGSFNKYAKEDEDGKLRVPEDSAGAFRADVDELLQSEIMFNIECLNIDEFGDAELRPLDLLSLQPFMCE